MVSVFLKVFHHLVTDPEKASIALRNAFTALMTSNPESVQEQLNKLLKRVRQNVSSGQDISTHCGELLLRLHNQFPGDVGCFCIYFLNHIVLNPGQAMFLGPNLPHAYLAGGTLPATLLTLVLLTNMYV